MEEGSKEPCDVKAMAAVGGARGRPCDACGVRRARWFCSADDASLCAACDTSVHSANSVASRHERLRLEPSQSDLRSSGAAVLLDGRSSWRLKRSRYSRRPEKSTAAARPKGKFEVPSVQQDFLKKSGDGSSGTRTGEFRHFLESDAELCGLEVEELGLDCFNAELCNANGSESGEGSSPAENGNLPFDWLFDRVKVEVSDDGDLEVEVEDDPQQEPFDLNIDLFDFVNDDEDDGKVKLDPDGCEERKICLTLDYEAVLNAWSDRGSPWADENTLRTFLDDSGYEGTIQECFPIFFFGFWQGGLEYGLVPDLNVGAGCCGERIGQVPVMGGGESQRKWWGGREARVMRYREKRRSRLFSKRIRYEVRKVNAEKRPRMKGRFVKKPPEVSLEGIGHIYKR